MYTVQDYLKHIRQVTVNALETETDGAISRYWMVNDSETGTVYVEHLIVGVDSLWTVGPVVFDNGAILDEQYTTESFDEAARLLLAACKA